VGAQYEHQLRDRRSLDNRRVKARLIDLLITACALLVLVIVFGSVPDHWMLVFTAVVISYFFVCEATWGYTVGKYHQGLRVVKTDGSPPGAGSVAARNILRVVEEPLLAVIVMVCSGKRRQRIGDFVGSTAVGSVVYSDSPEPTRARWIYPVLWIGAALAVGLLLVAPEDRYMRQVNSLCASYAVQGRGAPTAQAAFESQVHASHQFLTEVEAIDPPASASDRHQQIVTLLRTADFEANRAIVAAEHNPHSEQAFEAAYARFRARYINIGRDLFRLGLTCRA